MPPLTEPITTPLPELRRGVLAQFDRTFLAVLATFLSVEFTGALALAQRPRLDIDELSLQQPLPERWTRTLMPRPTPLPPPPRKPATVAVRSPLPHPSLPATPKPAPRTDEELRAQLGHMGTLAVLTSQSNPLVGLVEQAIGPTAMERQVEDAIKDAKGRLDQGRQAEGQLVRKDTGSVTSTIDTPMTEPVRGTILGAHRESGVALVPGVVIDHPEVPGAPGLERDRITTFVKGQLGRVQACYEHELKLHPEMHGRFVLRFVVGTDGSVVDADADEDDMSSGGLERCLVDRVAKHWKLPVHPEEETPVVYPFVFAPQSG